MRQPWTTSTPMRVLALCLVLAAATPAPGRAVYEEGERIELTGIVTDPAGLPIPNLHVVLEAARSRFSLRKLRRAKADVSRLTGLTNERGEYSLEWVWNGYYNTFELLVGIPVRGPEGERLKVLERVDLTRRIEQGSPVVASVVVENADFVVNLRSFLATIESEDERKVHREMGEPDKVERVDFPDHREVSWWYFESGKVYRFREGSLERIEPFDPVEPFDGGP